MFYASSPCKMRVRSSFINSGLHSRGCRWKPGGSSLFFASSKKIKSPAGARPGMLAVGTSLITVQRRQKEASK